MRFSVAQAAKGPGPAAVAGSGSEGAGAEKAEAGKGKQAEARGRRGGDAGLQGTRGKVARPRRRGMRSGGDATTPTAPSDQMAFEIATETGIRDGTGSLEPHADRHELGLFGIGKLGIQVLGKAAKLVHTP